MNNEENDTNTDKNKSELSTPEGGTIYRSVLSI